MSYDTSISFIEMRERNAPSGSFLSYAIFRCNECTAAVQRVSVHYECRHLKSFFDERRDVEARMDTPLEPAALMVSLNPLETADAARRQAERSGFAYISPNFNADKSGDNASLMSFGFRLKGGEYVIPETSERVPLWLPVASIGVRSAQLLMKNELVTMFYEGLHCKSLTHSANHIRVSPDSDINRMDRSATKKNHNSWTVLGDILSIAASKECMVCRNAVPSESPIGLADF